MKKQDIKSALQQLSPEELAIYKQLNSQLSNLQEAPSVRDGVRNIINNWKGWSTAMLMAIVLNSNMANAIERYSPQTLDAIKTEISKDTTSQQTPTQATPQTKIANAVKVINFSDNFESGKTKLTKTDTLVAQLDDLKNWLVGKDRAKFKIVITAGESQVTNPKGFEQKGSLAQARAKEVEKVIKAFGFDKTQTDVEIGTTPYKQGDNVNDPRYKAEQFVTVTIVADNNVCSMQPINGGGSQGTAAGDYVTSTEYVSGKGYMVLKAGQVPDRLVIVDGNGNIKDDTGYVTTQASKYKDWKYTPIHVLELTKAYQQNTKATQGNKIKTITVKDYQDLISQLSNTPNPQLTGDEIGPALIQMKKMIEKGQKQFVIYDISTSDVKIPFDDSRGDVQAIVYSPIGNTGYTVSGLCTN